MNLIDLTVIEVTKPSYRKYGMWLVEVKAEAYGRESNHVLMLDTKEEADAVGVGTVFQA